MPLFSGQAIPVFMSSMSIGAIALDRYRCIMQVSHYCFYRKDIEPLYHSFMYSLVSLLSGLYSLPTMHSLLVTLYAPNIPFLTTVYAT